MGAIIRMALAHLQLDVLQAQPAFTVPLSDEYLRELHACWRDTRALSHATSDGWTLAAMQDAANVPIAPHHRQFLQFAFQGRHFQFRVFPWGLFLSPQVFTRCMAAALSPLQSRGIKILPYLDDWLVCAPSRSQVTRDTAILLSHVAQLGLRLNFTKSCLVPSQSTLFLGVTLDAVAMKACPSPQRWDDILRLLLLFQEGRRSRYVQYMRLLGKLTAAAHCGSPRVAVTASPSEVAIQLPLGCQAAPEQKTQDVTALPPCSGPMEGEIISPSGHAHGLHCIPSGDCHNRRIPLRVGCCVAEPDSSRPVACTGLLRVHQCAGATGIAQGTAGLSSVPDGEACASTVRQRLNCLSRKPPRGNQVCTAVAGVLGPPVVAGPPVSIRAMYLPGERNRPADFLSRCKPPPGEWRLHPEVVLNILDVFDGAEVDLFATEESTHCPHGSP